MDENYVKSLVHGQMKYEKEQILKELKKENEELRKEVEELKKDFLDLKKEVFSFKYEMSVKINDFIDRVETILKGGTLPLFLSIISITLGGLLLFFGVLDVNMFLGIIDKINWKTGVSGAFGIISLFLGFMLLYYAYDILRKRI